MVSCTFNKLVVKSFIRSVKLKPAPEKPKGGGDSWTLHHDMRLGGNVTTGPLVNHDAALTLQLAKQLHHDGLFAVETVASECRQNTTPRARETHQAHVYVVPSPSDATWADPSPHSHAGTSCFDDAFPASSLL